MLNGVSRSNTLTVVNVKSRNVTHLSPVFYTYLNQSNRKRIKCEHTYAKYTEYRPHTDRLYIYKMPGHTSGVSSSNQYEKT